MTKLNTRPIEHIYHKLIRGTEFDIQPFPTMELILRLQALGFLTLGEKGKTLTYTSKLLNKKDTKELYSCIRQLVREVLDGEKFNQY